LDSPRDRFLSALQGRRTERAPLAYVAALTNVDIQKQTGCFMPEAHLDGAKLFRLCAAAHEVLRFDAVTFLINAFYEPAALGCDMDWGTMEFLPTYRSHPWRAPEDARIPPDLLSRQPIQTYLDSLKRAKRSYGERVAVVGKVLGPLTLVQVMHGVERTMIGLIDDPDKIRRFLIPAVEVASICANAQFDEGIDAVSIGEGGAGANMLSPEMYEDTLQEFHQRLISKIRGPTVMHICGDITPRLDSLKRVGFDCFNFDWAIPPRAMREKSEGRFSLMGNINTTDLHLGTPAEIERQVAENLEAGVDIISPGCAVSPLCPTENLLALASGIDKWYQSRRSG